MSHGLVSVWADAGSGNAKLDATAAAATILPARRRLGHTGKPLIARPPARAMALSRSPLQTNAPHDVNAHIASVNYQAPDAGQPPLPAVVQVRVTTPPGTVVIVNVFAPVPCDVTVSW